MKRVDVEHGEMVIVVARDITERRASEVEKARLQRELSQSQKMDALGQLTSGIAHDFNNILGIIIGYTELAIDRYNNANQAIPINYIEHIHESAERAKKLIAQLMVFGRSDNTESFPLQVAPLIAEDIKMLRATMPSSIQFDHDYQDDLPNVLMEPVKLQQLLLNLCINAKDAMNGTGRISISLDLFQDMNTECAACHKRIEGDWVRLTVADDGSGIDQITQSQMFDPFFTTKSSGKGTGMGLAMVGSIMESHHGHITVDTEPGLGTSIHLLFPPVEEETPQKDQHDIAVSIENPKGNGESILLVDDESGITNFMSEVLTNNGYKCTSLTSSKQALEVYSSSPGDFDLIITDQTMPELTGTELSKAISKIEPNQLMILMSGNRETIDNSIINDPDTRCIQKPIDIPVTISLIRNLLDQNMADNKLGTS